MHLPGVVSITPLEYPCAESTTKTSTPAFASACTLSSKPELAPIAAPTNNLLILTFFTSLAIAKNLILNCHNLEDKYKINKMKRL